MAESSCRAASTQHYRKCQQKPVVSKPYPISDLIPRNWGSSNEKGESRHFMSDLHLWMQAWSNEGGLARTEIADGRVHAEGNGKKGGTGTEKGGKCDSGTCWACGKAGHIAASCPKGGNGNLYAMGEEESEVNEETVDNGDAMQAWCLCCKRVNMNRGKK